MFLETHVLHIESIERKKFNQREPGGGSFASPKNTFFVNCNLGRTVQHVIILLKQISSSCCRTTCPLLYYKTTCSPDGSSNLRAPEFGFENRHYLYRFILFYVKFTLKIFFLLNSYFICVFKICY